jgi:hypothetical protein
MVFLHREGRHGMQTLSHLTLNTGHVTRSPRSDVEQGVVDRLLSMVDADEGTFPELGLAFDVMRPLDAQGRPRPGAAFFQVAAATGMSREPYVLCVACWRPDLSSEAWAQALGAYENLRPMLQATRLYEAPPPRLPPVPWLAVVITPFMATLTPEKVTRLGDMERCLFWALAEGN